VTDTSARVPAWSTESMILACQPDWLKVRARLLTPADIVRLGLELPASPADPIEPVPRVEA